MTLFLETYRGYANEQEIIFFGHMYASRSRINYELNGRRVRHAFAVLRMFTIRPIANCEVQLEFNGKRVNTKTLADGYFRFSIPYSETLKSGWHKVVVRAEHEGQKMCSNGEFIKPFPGEYGLISDIDDTFLISHSGNFFKKLYVLLTQNIYRRNTFDKVVEHYRLLSHVGRIADSGSNAFFYVSSSEWNLYKFINRFTEINDFPKAVIKLKKIKKGLADFLSSGRGDHNHKFQKIKDILEFYPELKFILLGDDSQKDPFIYERIVKLFPQRVLVVYMRQISAKPKKGVEQVLKNISDMGTETFYFSESAAAIEHTKSLGLVAAHQ
ncbi:App1 family protein [Zobellia alginiliquefaciens]|uniref:App1 family protein n=1 Tax=Zobellia alginiliquefaciens TaxID=3032586 RepID=UPI0023E16A90|nr:App1 family protein [Zobellia alginiliquefaciens]